MLKVFNDLEVFFEDCYRKLSVREYARNIKVTPPTSSTSLESYFKEGLLLRERYRNNILYSANMNDANFIALSRLYWQQKLEEFIALAEKEMVNPVIVLFGSLSKAEARQDSDIDIAIFATKKELNVKEMEKRLKRKVQIFWFESAKEAKSAGLLNNIVNGYILAGRLEI